MSLLSLVSGVVLIWANLGVRVMMNPKTYFVFGALYLAACEAKQPAKSTGALQSQTLEPLIFDQKLTQAYDYFEALKGCETDSAGPAQDVCLQDLRRAHSSVWGEGDSPRYRFANYRFTDPYISDYTVEDFNWALGLRGQLNNFVLSYRIIFPPDIHRNVLNAYIDYHEDNEGVMRRSPAGEDRSKYKVKSLETLQDNYPEFHVSGVLPEEYMRSKSFVDGYELRLISAENLAHSAWNTSYSADGCRRGESFFYKMKIKYESAWLADYFGGRDLAYWHVCASSGSGGAILRLPRVRLFKLGFAPK